MFWERNYIKMEIVSTFWLNCEPNSFSVIAKTCQESGLSFGMISVSKVAMA